MKNLGNGKQRLLIFVAVFAVVGAAVLLITKAATPSLSVEPENGQLAGAELKDDDPNASSGKYIKFGSDAPPPPSGSDFHTCFPDAFCTPSNQPVVMNGANIRYVAENTNVTSAAQMQKLKDKGFNSVRLVMDWEFFQPSAGTGGLNATAFTNLRTAVNNAKAAGIYVILDPIHFGGTGTSCGTSSLCIPSWARVSISGTHSSAVSVQTNAKDYIEKVSGDYANETTVVAIDLVNEPKPGKNNSELISMYNTLIGWARGKDPDKILMIEPNSGGNMYSVAELSALNKVSNLIFSFHHYYGGPFGFDSNGNIVRVSGCTDGGFSTGGGGGECGSATYEGGAGYPQINPSYLKAKIEENQKRLTDSGQTLPIWIGEWGIIEGVARNNSVQYRKDMTAIFKDMKIGRAYWQFANSFNDPPGANMSMTAEGSSTPGAFKSWVSDIL